MNGMVHRELDRNRMVKVVGMLGSEHPGEREAAVVRANRMLSDAGMSWEEFLDGGPDRDAAEDEIERRAEAMARHAVSEAIKRGELGGKWVVPDPDPCRFGGWLVAACTAWTFLDGGLADAVAVMVVLWWFVGRAKASATARWAAAVR